jgi:hypothetical protein
LRLSRARSVSGRQGRRDDLRRALPPHRCLRRADHGLGEGVGLFAHARQPSSKGVFQAPAAPSPLSQMTPCASIPSRVSVRPAEIASNGVKTFIACP